MISCMICTKVIASLVKSFEVDLPLNCTGYIMNDRMVTHCVIADLSNFLRATQDSPGEFTIVVVYRT